IALISGGGASHEPAHAGYTEHGMLTSSVSGDIFASPSAKQILAAIELAAFSGDILIVINNYTGDRLNFGLAIEQAQEKYPELNIMSVLNADDVSLLPQTRGGEGEGGMVGPRGNILVCKVLVSTPPTYPRPTLDRTKLLGDALVAHLRSLGATLGHCHVPGREPQHSFADCNNGSLAFELIPPSQIELGLGLHNEPGVRRTRENNTMPTGPGSGLGTRLLFINNLGGVSTLEMGAVVELVRKELASHGMVPARIYSAPYMTSLNAPGFSISLVNVTRTEAEETLLSIRTSFSPAASATSSLHAGASQGHGGFAWTDLGFSAEEIERGVRGACESVFAAEADMTRFDTVVGDGDCGETFVGGGRAILVALDSHTLNPQTMGPALFVSKVGEILEGCMGGTIGELFAIFFTAWSIALRRSTHAPLNEALVALGKHTPARPGDRTVVDALASLCEIMLSRASSSTTTLTTADLEEAAEATKRGAESTRGMRARLGRASYV
ncbi:hypothetical protein PAXINDRAFT_45011, partial [Paxillus involutus ATCC 200175]